MNKGKICISVCAETAEALFGLIKRAEDLADVIEIRLDCLLKDQIIETIKSLQSEKPILLTYRPIEQGGRVKIEKQERIEFWNGLSADGSLDKRNFWIDCEFDLKSEVSDIAIQKLISFHDFSGVPYNIEQTIEDLTENGSITKIAFQADDITDTIAIWKLLEKSKLENREMIPIAMGESGKWTRILGLAHGAFMTYAALDSGKETAPGQVSAEDLIKVYRAKELNEKTDIYGIIAGNTSYSMSPYIHNAAFNFHKLNSVFIPLQVKDLGEFLRRMVFPETREVGLNFKGFAVTNPHKQEIIKYLDEIDESARSIGAVNTIKIIDGRLCGYNTDANGFITPLKDFIGDLRGKNIAVIGTGGAARACVYALMKEGANVNVFGRNLSSAIALANEFNAAGDDISNLKLLRSDFEIVVNTTPLGTIGEYENQTLLDSGKMKDLRLAYDLVYNPFETRFLREAKTAGVATIGGFEMLIAQALEQSKIWTGKVPPKKEMRRAALDKLQKRQER